MVKLCLMASHGYPPGLVFHPDHGFGRASKDNQWFLHNSGHFQDLLKSSSSNLKMHQSEELCRHMEDNQMVKVDSPTRRPTLVDVQETHPNSILFSFGIAEHCTRHQKILRYIMSGPDEVHSSGLDSAMLSDLMGPLEMNSDMHQQPFSPYWRWCFHKKGSLHSLIYPSNELYMENPLQYFVDSSSNSEMMHQLGGQELYTGTGIRTEMREILSIIAQFYLSDNSMKWRRQSMVVPYFNRRASRGTRSNIHQYSPTFESVKVDPLQSTEKVKSKTSTRKKSNRKASKERDASRSNYLHACESLLSILVDKKRHGKTAILSLRKCSSQLPQLLTHFSASIAGTGLAVIFSVVCKVACGRVPFCASKLWSTSLGLGLVWLSWAVNNLRDTVISISKNSSKPGSLEDDMMNNLDNSVKEIYFRAAALMAVAVLRLA